MMPQLTENVVLQLAEEAIVDRQLAYDQETGLKARFDGPLKLRGGHIIPTWTVSYLTEKNPYFDQEMHFIYIDDNATKVLYIITPTTYIE